MSPRKVPVQERLFALLNALVATKSGLTKNEILSSVTGYNERFREGRDNSAVERQFERDKDDLRELGIPLETVEDPGDPGNNQSMRYRVPKKSYDLPDDITFTPAEWALLSMASHVWQEGSLSAESRRAIIKLRALGVDVDDPIVGYAPRVHTREASFTPFTVAIDRRTVVEFDYLKPGHPAPTRRVVEPLALLQFKGRWLVHGYDRGVGDLRTFLLSRVIGEPRLTAITFTRDEPSPAARAEDELVAIWERNVAEVDVVADTDAWLQLSGREDTQRTDTGTLLVHYSDLALLADELASYGPEVLALSPQPLVQAVRERLGVVIAAHTAAVEPTGSTRHARSAEHAERTKDADHA